MWGESLLTARIFTTIDKSCTKNAESGEQESGGSKKVGNRRAGSAFAG
jgi:hypothetical protein